MLREHVLGKLDLKLNPKENIWINLYDSPVLRNEYLSFTEVSNLFPQVFFSKFELLNTLLLEILDDCLINVFLLVFQPIGQNWQIPPLLEYPESWRSLRIEPEAKQETFLGT